jgi:hypothetical protein
MPKYLMGLLAAAALAGCSQEPPDDSSADGKISGPFPKTVSGTIGSSYPLEDGSGRVILWLLEYDNAAIIVSAETYDAKGMEEDDAEVSLTVEPISSEECDADQCFKGY